MYEWNIIWEETCFCCEAWAWVCFSSSLISINRILIENNSGIIVLLPTEEDKNKLKMFQL